VEDGQGDVAWRIRVEGNDLLVRMSYLYRLAAIRYSVPRRHEAAGHSHAAARPTQ
jgi:hypothetical protein